MSDSHFPSHDLDISSFFPRNLIKLYNFLKSDLFTFRMRKITFQANMYFGNSTGGIATVQQIRLSNLRTITATKPASMCFETLRHSWHLIKTALYENREVDIRKSIRYWSRFHYWNYIYATEIIIGEKWIKVKISADIRRFIFIAHMIRIFTCNVNHVFLHIIFPWKYHSS